MNFCRRVVGRTYPKSMKKCDVNCIGNSLKKHWKKGGKNKKKPLKNRCRKRYGKGVKKTKNICKYFPKWDAGGSRGMLASCTAPSPALNPQIIAHPNKGKVPAANNKKGKCGGGMWWEGAFRCKSPEKDAEKTDVRGDEGAFTLNSTLPFGREAARGRISVACGNGSAPGPL